MGYIINYPYKKLKKTVQSVTTFCFSKNTDINTKKKKKGVTTCRILFKFCYSKVIDTNLWDA